MTRFLLDTVLLLGACPSPKAILNCIANARISIEETVKFFFDHVVKDIETLGKTINESIDHAAVLLHEFLRRILDNSQRASQRDLSWRDQESRLEWEKSFAQEFVQGVVENREGIIRQNMMLIAQDDRGGKRKLIERLCSPASSKGNLNLDALIRSESVWLHRERITLAFFLTCVQESKESHPLLLDVLEKRRLLVWLWRLPDMMAMIDQLNSHLGHVVSRSDAKKKTIREVVNRMLKQGEQRDKLIKRCAVFFAAFSDLQPLLQRSYRTLESLPTSLSLDSPLAALLPSSRGDGVCVKSVMTLLARCNNELLEAAVGKGPLRTIPIQQVDSASLVAIRDESELLSVVTSHCKYHLEAGKETKRMFDFAAIDRQIRERLFRGKSKVEMKSFADFAYKDDYNTAWMQQLRRKVEQESLDEQVVAEIENQFRRQMQELNDHISILDTSIRFLLTVGGESSLRLHEYVKTTLLFDNWSLGSKGDREVQLKHIEDLWLHLAFQRAILQSESNLDPFDAVADQFKADIDEEHRSQIGEWLKVVKWKKPLKVIFEFIMTRVKTYDDSVDEEHRFPKYLIRAALSSAGDEPIDAVVNRIPDGLVLEQIVTLWKTIFQLGHRRGTASS